MVPPALRQRLVLYQKESSLRSRIRRVAPVVSEHVSDTVYFMHIPKNAGTSIARELCREAGFERLVWTDSSGPPPSNRWISDHKETRFWVNNGVLSQEWLDEAFSFAVVRNPFTRSLSLYRYLRQGLRSQAFPDHWRFVDFLRHLKSERPRIGGVTVARCSQAAPQSDWLLGRRENYVKRIFRFEALGEMQNELSSLFQVPLNFGHLNRSPLGSSAHDWKDEEVALITKLYQRDFVLLEYSLDPPSPQDSGGGRPEPRPR